MNKKWTHRNSLVVLALFALVILLGGCGNSNQKSTSPAESSSLATATVVGLRTCTGCHTAVTADWMASRHANAEGGLDSPGYPTLGQISSCTQNCHDPNGDSGNLTANYTGNVPRPVIGCEACHGPGSLHANDGGSGAISRLSGTFTLASYSLGTVSVSGQFMMCSVCHELLDSSGTGTTVATHGPTTSSPTPTGSQYVITDTHFAVGAFDTTGKFTGLTGTATGANITGYAMDYNSPTVCSDCHNPHGTADINRDWSASKHADKKGSSNNGGPWGGRNWSCDGTSVLACGPTPTYVAPLITDNRYCQRCHTKTGFAAYADAIRSGNTALFQALDTGNYPPGLSSPVKYQIDWKPEMLECLGCHTDNLGTMRNPGAFTATYDFRTTPVGAPAPNQVYAHATFQYPDLGGANVCILCHSGRTNGATIKNLNTDPTLSIADLSILKAADSHHFPVAATMFKGLGYEYAGRNYANASTYKHFVIGTPAVPNTGTNGPCVGCHMFRSSGPASHLFEAVSKTGSTVVSVSSEVCFNCHEGSSTSLAAVVDAERLAFTYALAVLKTQVTTTNAIHPAMTSSTTNWLASGDTDTSGNTTGKNNLGAYFNFTSLNGNEMGAYIHNSKYTKRLIYDAIDWLDDGMLNYSAGTTLQVLCSTATPTCATGMNYILPNGVLNGDPAERP